MDAQSRRCPRCEYLLNGLPETHTCPECGLEYDPDCVVLRCPGSKLERRQIGYTVLLLALVWIVGSKVSPSRGGWLLVAIAATLAGNVFALVRKERTTGLLMLSRKGLEFCWPDGRDERLAWSAVSRARIGWITGALRLYNGSGVCIERINGDSMGGVRSARRCCGEINRLVTVYG